MGSMLLNHLGGGQGGIEHFFHQFAGPVTAWWKSLGQPELTPEVQKKLIDSVHAEVGSRTTAALIANSKPMMGVSLRRQPGAPTRKPVHKSSSVQRKYRPADGAVGQQVIKLQHQLGNDANASARGLVSGYQGLDAQFPAPTLGVADARGDD
jgi:hypothetical protein